MKFYLSITTLDEHKKRNFETTASHPKYVVRASKKMNLSLDLQAINKLQALR
jgi:hypothetical protein